MFHKYEKVFNTFMNMCLGLKMKLLQERITPALKQTIFFGGFQQMQHERLKKYISNETPSTPNRQNNFFGPTMAKLCKSFPVEQGIGQVFIIIYFFFCCWEE